TTATEVPKSLLEATDRSQALILDVTPSPWRPSDTKHINKSGSVNGAERKEDVIRALVNVNLPSRALEPVTAPFEYICSLKSKYVPEKLICALHPWIPIARPDLELVMSLVADIHNTSLMLDDIQDASALRRSSPATHTVFGTPQTINSAVYQTVNTIQKASNSGNPQLVQVVTEGMKELLVGQGLDLVWTSEVAIPSLENCLQMIDGKTGALFLMVIRLMDAFLPASAPKVSFNRFMLLLGRYFQIRDDYINLVSTQYSDAIGFCTDLDEGKCSFIILHAMNNASRSARNLLKNLLLQTRRAGCAGERHKELMFSIFKEAGSLEYTADMLGEIKNSLSVEMERIETTTGVNNPVLKEFLNALRA
ncbi:uncharacterized protein PpBr36_10645, partial [Pyricularia pennisetigena]|uniref:uncharacterized protein n=1 Tax=Pyricularia pennisetigena TaxID=1578925 RepID=UPI001150E429